MSFKCKIYNFDNSYYSKVPIDFISCTVVLPFIYAIVNVLVLQSHQCPMVVLVPRPMLSYFLSAMTKNWNHSRAWWQNQGPQQSTEMDVMVQHLVTGGTSLSLPMRTDIMIHIQNLVPTTLLQVESKIHSQSSLVLSTFHLMTGKCSTSVDLSYHHC